MLIEGWLYVRERYIQVLHVVSKQPLISSKLCLKHIKQLKFSFENIMIEIECNLFGALVFSVLWLSALRGTILALLFHLFLAPIQTESHIFISN